MQPLVIAYHLIWTAYGYWLPNDPRGSHSESLRMDLLADLGELHLGRKKIQPYSHTIRDFYNAATPLLKHPTLPFIPIERDTIAQAFANVITLCKYTVYACAIMPDHVHILIRKHKHQVEEMSQRLHDESRTLLRRQNHREPQHPIWSNGCGWKVFLDHPTEVHRTIRYINDNPIKIGLPAQDWPFVTFPYNNWPLHPGHNPNSPWARRLRNN